MHLCIIKSTRKLKCFSLTIVVNLHLENLMHFVNYMALFDNLNFKSCAMSTILIVCRLYTPLTLEGQCQGTPWNTIATYVMKLI
jgi:hypothetical protein